MLKEMDGNVKLILQNASTRLIPRILFYPLFILFFFSKHKSISHMIYDWLVYYRFTWTKLNRYYKPSEGSFYNWLFLQSCEILHPLKIFNCLCQFYKYLWGVHACLMIFNTSDFCEPYKNHLTNRSRILAKIWINKQLNF